MYFLTFCLLFYISGVEYILCFIQRTVMCFFKVICLPCFKLNEVTVSIIMKYFYTTRPKKRIETFSIKLIIFYTKNMKYEYEFHSQH